MAATVSTMNATANQDIRENFAKRKNVLMTAQVMEYVKIINVFALMGTSVKTVPYMNALIIARNTAHVIVKLENVLVILASSELTAQKRTVPTIAQEKVIATMKQDYVNAKMAGIMKIALAKLALKIALVMVFV